jgi:hypothetical protein
MEKMKEKNKIYKINHQHPLKSSYNDGKYQFPNSRGQQPKLKLSQWQKTVLPLKSRQITSSPSNQVK